MNTPDTVEYDPTPYIVPLEQGAPNPYDDPEFDGKQADEGPGPEGLGGTLYPESPLGVKAALYRLYQLAESNATVQWDGKTPIKGMCLAVQHNASEIGAQHYDAQQDCDNNPDRRAVTYDTVDWSKVPDGSFVYWRVGQHGHIARKTTHNGKVLIVSSDVIPGQIGYADPLWFRVHWGAELEAVSRICNSVWQKGIDGNDDGQDQGGQGGSGKGTGELATELEAIISALGGAHQKVWTKFESLGKVTTDHPKWALLKEAADLIQQAEPLLKAARTNILTFQKG